MTTKALLPGIVGSDGRVRPTPMVVTLDADGRVLSAEPLGAHEPDSTIFMSGLYDVTRRCVIYPTKS